MSKQYQPLVSLGNDMGVTCLGCDKTTRYMDTLYGTITTAHRAFGASTRKDGTRFNYAYPITFTGRWCVACTRLGVSFKLQEER